LRGGNSGRDDRANAGITVSVMWSNASL
jgi:hypothetical protein